MRRSVLVSFGSMLILGLGGPSCAAGASTPDPAPLVTETTKPVYPPELEFNGPRAGEADVVVAVDAAGNLQDVLVIGYSRKAFATEAVRAIRTWKFSPPPGLKEGQTWTHIFQTSYWLEKRKVAIYSPATHPGLAGLRELAEDDKSLTYRFCNLRDLDRIPRPLAIVAPTAARGGTVDLQFYIDEDGRVRIPSIRHASDPDLIPAALAAVRQWRFEPPRRDGAPVLVLVGQVFHFEPTAAIAHPPHEASQTNPEPAP